MRRLSDGYKVFMNGKPFVFKEEQNTNKNKNIIKRKHMDNTFYYDNVVKIHPNKCDVGCKCEDCSIPF